ncbi:hypothetical protein HpMS107_57580 [Helicobacter pylori]
MGLPNVSLTADCGLPIIFCPVSTGCSDAHALNTRAAIPIQTGKRSCMVGSGIGETLVPSILHLDCLSAYLACYVNTEAPGFIPQDT